MKEKGVIHLNLLFNPTDGFSRLFKYEPVLLLLIINFDASIYTFWYINMLLNFSIDTVVFLCYPHFPSSCV